jgi:methionyl-tRNA formyltransferase
MIKTITFFALGEKAYIVLSGLLPRYASIVSTIIIARDSGIADDFADKIIDICKQHEVKYIERTECISEQVIFDGYCMAIGWRWLISWPDHTLIVLHDSILPRYRGFAPLVSCLVNGEEEIGVTALFGSKKYDHGEIIHQKSTKICYPLRINDAIHKISNLYLEIATLIIHDITQGNKLVGTPQIEECATYSLWRDNKDYFISWGERACDIARFVDAVGYPYDGAKSHLNGHVIKINAVEVRADVTIEKRSAAIGKVIFLEDGKPVVICGTGLLKIVDATTIVGDSIFPLSKFRSRFS